MCKIAICDENDHKYVGTVTTVPTCTEKGLKTYICSACKDTYTEEIAIDSNNHDITEHQAKAPTCTEIGWEAYEACSRCDYTTYQKIPKTGHAQTKEYVVIDGVLYYAATCGCEDQRDVVEEGTIVEIDNEADLKTVLSAGYSIKLTADIGLKSNIELVGTMNVTIDLNGKTITADWKDENGVVDVLWAHGDRETNENAPTVTITGNGTMACGKNGNQTCVVSATDGATITIENGTFTSGGSACIYATRTGKVVINGGTFSADELYLGNGYLLDVNEAETLGTIIVYGGSFKSFNPANHTNDGDYTNKVADGYHSIKNGEYYVVSAHEYKTEVTKPTCTAAGYTTYTCECGDTYTEAGETALGHTDGETVVENEVAADCENDGSYDNVVYCSICEAEISRETITVGALGHLYTNDCDTTCNREGCTETREPTHTPADVVVENEVAADCENDGSYDNVVYCSVCGVETSRQTITVDALGHAMGAWEVTTAATCTEDGEKVQKCTRENCTHSVTETLTKLGHNLVDVDAKGATCTEDGYTAHKDCSRCDYTEGKTTIPASHDLVDVEAKEATCTEDGYTAHKDCSRCDYTEEKETLPALGHDYSYGTCDRDGCDATFVHEANATISFADTTHRVSLSTSAQVWAQSGLTVTNNKASSGTNVADYSNPARFYKSSTVTIEFPGMTQIVINATSGYVEGWKNVTSEGAEVTVSGTTVTIVFANPVDSITLTMSAQSRANSITVTAAGEKCEHEWDAEATCTTAQRCIVCGTVKEAAKGHTEVVDEAVDATCTETGLTEGKHCSVCNEIIVAQEVVDALGHTTVVDEAVAPKCEDAGLTEGSHCSVCNEVFVAQEEVEATGHNYADGVCTACGQAEGHVHNYVADVTEPTCTAPGFTTYTCDCEDSYIANEVPATGHTPGEAATCTTAQICTECEEVLAAALGHAWDNDCDTDCNNACGETREIEHKFADGKCTECGEKDPNATPVWTLVTDVSTLKAGDQIVIVAKASNNALSTTQNSNNRGKATVTKDGNTITFGNDVQILTLAAGNSTGTYAFNTGSGYLCSASSSKNYLRTQTTLDANGSWSISIAADGTATIKSTGSYSRNWLRYNSSSSIFACYSSGQLDVVIYKLG